MNQMQVRQEKAGGETRQVKRKRTGKDQEEREAAAARPQPWQRAAGGSRGEGG